MCIKKKCLCWQHLQVSDIFCGYLSILIKKQIISPSLWFALCFLFCVVDYWLCWVLCMQWWYRSTQDRHNSCPWQMYTVFLDKKPLSDFYFSSTFNLCKYFLFNFEDKRFPFLSLIGTYYKEYSVGVSFLEWIALLSIKVQKALLASCLQGSFFFVCVFNLYRRSLGYEVYYITWSL